MSRDIPTIGLRERGDGESEVVLSFPYDRALVELCRSIPHRRFDWDAREWIAPASDWAALKVAEALERFPELRPEPAVRAWLAGVRGRWIGSVSTAVHDGRGWWALRTLAGEVPHDLRPGSVTVDGRVLVPLTRSAAAALRAQRSARLDLGAERCAQIVELGGEPPPARLVFRREVDGQRLVLEVLWDPDVGQAFAKLPGAGGTRAMDPDPWMAPELDGFIARHQVQVTDEARAVLEALLTEHREAAAAVRRSRAADGEPIADVVSLLGGEPAPFQWAAVRYALDARGTFLADEQGLGKTVEALVAIEADGAYPAVVICPASIKLGWEREARRWLAHRSVSVLNGRAVAPLDSELTILNYEIVAAHRVALARMGPRALVVDESHYCKNPHAKRTQAVRRLSETLAPRALRLALTGTPVLNHAEELIAQLRIIGRLHDFGSGAAFARRFRGEMHEERLHWHLRRACFVRRRKAEVLPQLPPKRRVVIPVALTNAAEYTLAERDLIAWLRTQPLDLSELNARIASALRAQRLAQLTALQRLAARGKLGAALQWIGDFLASGEALVVFARHIEVQRALLSRFPGALHLLGEDPLTARERSIAAFQAADGPQLIVCATRVAAQGITLTRASNVAFLELEWTPALHDQAEDRCHRIGQRDAVTAWYLLAADTIDETIATLIAAKRATVDAVTDGVARPEQTLVDAIVAELRGREPVRHLRAVG